MKQLLNLGCGSRFHPLWTNVDFVSNDPGVVQHNLLLGIPFPDATFDVVYHSHVLEHFLKIDGESFIRECNRVLKMGGIIRIAVPDLESIAREYLKNLELALQGEVNAVHDYEWIKLEMYDQVVRNQSGGNMAEYLFQRIIPNEKYVFERIGEEGRSIRQSYFNRIDKSNTNTITKSDSKKKKGFVNQLKGRIKHKLKHILFQNELNHFEKLNKEIEIGKFRLGGEIHQWMYDRFSLSELLRNSGFSEVEVEDAFTSKIPEWNSYELETKNGVIYKPDSLFMEAVK